MRSECWLNEGESGILEGSRDLTKNRDCDG